MSTNVAGVLDYTFASSNAIDAMNKASAPHNMHTTIRGYLFGVHFVFACLQTSQVPMTH